MNLYHVTAFNNQGTLFAYFAVKADTAEAAESAVTDKLGAPWVIRKTTRIDNITQLTEL